LKLKLTVDGKLYEVDVEVAEEQQPHPSYIPPTRHTSVPKSTGDTSGAAAQNASQPASSEKQVEESKVCRSPVSGVVVKVQAQVGQSIQVDDVLIVLEAMKMETVITAPIAGKIAKLNVEEGQAVQAGQVLVEFD
jgi:methylmalonyl-CoA carboxyltransferase small subunit